MNDREFLTENQGIVNNTNPDTSNSYSDLDFSTLNTDNYQDSTEVYSAPVSEGSVNPFSSEVEAPDFATRTHEESVVASTEFFNQDDNDIFLDSEGVFHNETGGELGGTEATGVSRGNFAGDSIANQEEINSLIEDVVNDNELEVDRYGTIRNASANSGLHGTDATGVSQGGFAGDSIANQEEINSLIEDVVNDAELEVDRYGTIRNASADSGLHGTEATGVSHGGFAGDSIAAQDEINSLIDNVVNENELEVDHFGTIRNVSANNGLHGTDATGISQGDFAAQWYEKNPKLYQLEKKLMNQRFPNAKERKLSNGNLAWQIKMNISRTDAFDPWTFLLVYMPDHPNNTGYGGSVKVIPLVPNLEQLQSRVKASKGKYFSSIPPVPHVVGIDTKYLCTRASNDIEDGNTTITTAVQVAAWAAEWALYFELSMRDNRVWNKWVDDDHFRKWKII